MSLEALKKDFTEAEADVKSYFEHSEEYLKLKIFKILMGMITSSAQIVLVGAIALLALFILSFAASYAIGKILEDEYLGFVIVGMFYVLIAVICSIFREKLNRPLLRKFSKHYFD